jgi:hypothetical protein
MFKIYNKTSDPLRESLQKIFSLASLCYVEDALIIQDDAAPYLSMLIVYNLHGIDAY